MFKSLSLCPEYIHHGLMSEKSIISQAAAVCHQPASTPGRTQAPYCPALLRMHPWCHLNEEIGAPRRLGGMLELLPCNVFCTLKAWLHSSLPPVLLWANFGSKKQGREDRMWAAAFYHFQPSLARQQGEAPASTHATG